MEVQKQDKTPKVTEQKEFSDNPPIFFYDIIGNFRTSSVAPTIIPKKIQDQVVIVATGGTWKLYIADLFNSTWKFVNLS